MSIDSLQLVRVNNRLNSTYDLQPGGGDKAPGRNGGQLGLVVNMTKEHALQNSDPDVGVLYEGEYQYVQLDVTPIVDDVPVPPERGLLLFWTDRANHKVSTDDSVRSELAGVFLNNPLPNDEDPAGRYIFMQKVGFKSYGRATIKALTGTVFAEDDLVVAAGDGTAKADVVAVEGPDTAFVVGLAEGAMDVVTELVVARLGA